MTTDFEAMRKRRDRSNAAMTTAGRAVKRMTPADRVRLAREILREISEEGCSYADFQSAQATERYVRKAYRALDGLAL